MKFPDQNRIAMMIPTLAGGGAEHVFLNLAVGFMKAGYQVDLILKRATGEYLSQLPAGINLVDLNASGMAATLAGVRRYLRTQRPRVLLAGLDIPNLAAILARKISGSRTQVIVSVRSVISQQRRFFLPHRSLERAFMALIYPQANRILANSQGAAQDFSSYLHIPLSRVQMIYNPVITDVLLEKAQQPLEHNWFRAGEPPVILSAGRLNTVKDFPTLIKAFARIWQNTPARLLILGEGDRRSELEALVLQLGLQDAILLPGFQQKSLCVHAPICGFCITFDSRCIPQCPYRGNGVRLPGGCHRQPGRLRRTDRLWEIRAPGAGGR